MAEQYQVSPRLLLWIPFSARLYCYISLVRAPTWLPTPLVWQDVESMYRELAEKVAKEKEEKQGEEKKGTSERDESSATADSTSDASEWEAKYKALQAEYSVGAQKFQQISEEKDKLAKSNADQQSTIRELQQQVKALQEKSGGGESPQEAEEAKRLHQQLAEAKLQVSSLKRELRDLKVTHHQQVWPLCGSDFHDFPFHVRYGAHWQLAQGVEGGLRVCRGIRECVLTSLPAACLFFTVVVVFCSWSWQLCLRATEVMAVMQ